MSVIAANPHPKNPKADFSTSPQGGGQFMFLSNNLPLVGRSNCAAIGVGGAFR